MPVYAPPLRNASSRGENAWPGLTFAIKSANQSYVATGLFDVDDLVLLVGANTTAIFRFSVQYVSAQVTTGLVLGLNGPVTPDFLSYGVGIATSQTAAFFSGSTAFGVGATGSGSAGPTQPLPAWIDGTIVMGSASGTIGLQAGSETQGTSATIMEGSWGWIS